MNITKAIKTFRLSNLPALTGKILSSSLICLFILIGRGSSIAQMEHAAKASPPSDAKKAFEIMKTLVGSWDGNIMGLLTHMTIRVTSSGNAILHEATGPRRDDPITMFYVDGDRLLLTHYCDAGNRPRMVGKISPDGKTLEFDLIDVSGSTQHGMMNRMVFTIIDANHHSESGSWVLPGNKSMDVPPTIFTRTK